MPRKKQDPNSIPTESGSAGAPQRVDRAAVRRRAESPNLLTDEELQERQKKLRETRRSVPLPGAPATRRRSAVDAGSEEPPDVPETDCDEPPA